MVKVGKPTADDKEKNFRKVKSLTESSLLPFLPFPSVPIIVIEFGIGWGVRGSRGSQCFFAFFDLVTISQLPPSSSSTLLASNDVAP